MIFWTISGHLFAGDCLLYRNIDLLTDCQILQDDLNSLAQCETDNRHFSLLNVYLAAAATCVCM